ncbi:uncharacterized protein Pyn_06030 [Prunus yedoensis var. nudiflora]|uniref:Uncharacterized protein n=1 Tax=Prunus yedoensis var. nudiflora TaxID=2094558 RepID=A0A314Z1S4_PRUYE|nr:uncharacterized protein Pyn_06030 [Prunus yedoensis var. nudiflora]
MSSGLKSKVQDKFTGISSSEGLNQDNHSSDQLKKDDDLVDSSLNNLPDMNKPPGGLESEYHPPDRSQQNLNPDQSQPLSSNGSDVSGSVRNDVSESGNNDDESSQEKAPEYLYDKGQNQTQILTVPARLKLLVVLMKQLLMVLMKQLLRSQEIKMV